VPQRAPPVMYVPQRWASDSMAVASHAAWPCLAKSIQRPLVKRISTSTLVHVNRPTCTLIRMYASPSLTHNLKQVPHLHRYREPANRSRLRNSIFATFLPLTPVQSTQWGSLSQVKLLSWCALTCYNIRLRSCLHPGGLANPRDFCLG
jgi:hypothetical protein